MRHLVSKEGVRPNPNKIATIKDWPQPILAKQLRGFLGLTGYLGDL